jgi:hypothetical protein
MPRAKRRPTQHDRMLGALFAEAGLRLGRVVPTGVTLCILEAVRA